MLFFDTTKEKSIIGHHLLKIDSDLHLKNRCKTGFQHRLKGKSKRKFNIIPKQRVIFLRLGRIIIKSRINYLQPVLMKQPIPTHPFFLLFATLPSSVAMHFKGDCINAETIGPNSALASAKAASPMNRKSRIR